MADLTDLIERLEKATEGSRELDCNVAEAAGLGARRQFHPPLLDNGRPVPRFSESLDAALSLVPEGRYAKLQISHDHKRAWAWVEMEAGEAVACAAPALALCIAALKARQAAP